MCSGDFSYIGFGSIGLSGELTKYKRAKTNLIWRS